MQEALLKLCGLETRKKWKLLYRGTLHGFEASTFHTKCDNIAKTLTIIKAAESGNIFGGYTEVTWNATRPNYKEDKNAFVFSLVNKERTPVKVKIANEKQFAFIGNLNYGPVFGYSKCEQNNKNDICIVDKSNVCSSNYSNLGSCYTLPNYPPGSEEARNFLAGSYNFRVEEIEVFQQK
jgi:hypothetical protein